MDSELSMKQHISKVYASCFYHLRRLRQIRRQRSGDSSRPGTGNVEIRLLQLDASRSATNDDCTTVTRPERRCSPDFRVGHTRACHGEPSSVALAAGPLAGPFQAAVPHVDCGRPRRDLRSSSSTDFSLPRLRTKFGERAFIYAGPSAWNSLPEDLRAVSDPGLFRKQLKTHFSVWRLMSIDCNTPMS